jgi:lysophospholipase L1-like esterase
MHTAAFSTILFAGACIIFDSAFAFSAKPFVSSNTDRVAPFKAVPVAGSVIKYVAIGNSITAGVGDEYAADDTSSDGRNTGGGFEPILNDLLTVAKNAPHSVVNAGDPGTTSANGLSAINTILATHHDAYGFLVMYGTNDARPWAHIKPGPGPNTFQDNMQQIINAITAAGKKVWIARPPIALADGVNYPPYPDPDNGQRSLHIKEYIQIIANGLTGMTSPGPDFYTYFNSVDPHTGRKRYKDQYTDPLHPNGKGYQSMAWKWFESLSPASPPSSPRDLEIINSGTKGQNLSAGISAIFLEDYTDPSSP